MTRFVSFRGLIPIFCQASPSLHMTKVGQEKLMLCCSMLRKGEKVNFETAVSLFNFSAIPSANARTSEADTLHLEKKATKSTTRMYVCMCVCVCVCMYVNLYLNTGNHQLSLS